MPPISRGTLRLLFILVAVPLLLVLLFPDRLLETFHPWLERVVSGRLAARVSWDRLSLRRGMLTVFDLQLEQDGAWRTEVPRLEVSWRVAGLLFRRLETVRIEEPSLKLFLAGGRASLPDRLPWEIGQLTIVSGRVEAEAAGRTFLLREVTAQARLAPRSPFRADLRLGEGNGLPLHLGGIFTWGEPPSVLLEEATWAGRPLLVAPLVVRLPAGGATAEGVLRLDRFDTAQLRTLLAAFRLVPSWPESWSFVLSAPEVRFGLTREGWRVQLRVPTAQVVAENLLFPLEAAEVDLRQQGGTWGAMAGFRLAGAPGRLRATLAGEHAEGSLAVAVIDPAELKRQIFGGGFPPLAGGFDIEARFARDGENGGFRLRAKMRGRTGRRPNDYLLDIAPLSADLNLDRPVGRDLAIRGVVRVEEGEILRLQGTPAHLEAELLPAAGRKLPLLFLPLSASATARQIEGVVGRAVLASAPGGWEGEGVLTAAAFPLPGGELRQVAARGSLDLNEEGLRLDLDALSVADLEFAAADGLSAVSGGHLEGSGRLEAKPGEALQLALTASLGIRELLRGPFYGDFSAFPLKLNLHGRLGERSWSADRLTLSSPGVVEADLRGAGTPGKVAIAGTVRLPDLALLQAGPLGEALTTLHPGLSGLQPAGAIEAEFSWRSLEGRGEGSGELRLSGVAIEWPEAKLAARGIGGTVPFLLTAGGERTATLRRGELAIESLHFGPAILANRTIPLAVSAGSLRLETPLDFALAGGELQVGDAALALAGAPEVSATVRLRQVDLGELTRGLELPVLAGRISADLGLIRYREGTLVTGGALGINAFGGDILVRNLRLESLFSARPTTRADVDFTGIDLRQLTRTLEFGEINGIADGRLHGLRLYGSVPSEFEAFLETREKGERNISVSALNNLAVISQGGVASALTRGVYRFIDFYRYRKIGIRCSLRNDLFTLRGSARPGSENYLVYGGLLPPKIDIIAPVHQISFKEMMRRLQRIKRTADVDSEGRAGKI